MARKSSRAEWTEFVKHGKSRKVASIPSGLMGNKFSGVVLGIDPSLRGTGLAVVEVTAPSAPPKLLEARTLKLKKSLGFPECLGEISKAVNSLIGAFPVEHVALEQTIYVQNFQTAQILGAARGAAIAPAAVKGKAVFEYPPLRIKQAVVGFGRASKEQVSRTIAQLLRVNELETFDESDASAVALCHILTYRE